MFKIKRQNQCLVLKIGVRRGSGFPVTEEAHIYTQ